MQRAAAEEAERHLRPAEAKAPAGEYADRVKFHRFGQDYTRVMLGLLEAYRELNVLGVRLDLLPLLKERRDAPAERHALLQREAMLRAPRLGRPGREPLLVHQRRQNPPVAHDGEARARHCQTLADFQSGPDQDSMKHPISLLLHIAAALLIAPTFAQEVPAPYEHDYPEGLTHADLGKYFNASVIEWLHAKLAPAAR